MELAAALLTSAAYPDAATDQAADVHLGALVGQARGMLRHCADPGPLVTMWLAEEQRAEAARTRQQGLSEPWTDRELTILRMLPTSASLRELAVDLFVTLNTGQDLRRLAGYLGGNWEPGRLGGPGVRGAVAV